jgi:hypothetical protein
MGRLAIAASAATVILASVALSPIAAAETTHTYPVSLTISVDRSARQLNGTIVTEAPSEFCDSSTIRIRVQMPGKDDVVKTVPPYGGEFHAHVPKFIRGKRVYAEVLSYHLPSRPVVCLAARSRTVTAP